MYRTGVTQWFLNCSQGPISLQRARELGFDSIHVNSGTPFDSFYIGDPDCQRAYHEMIEKYDMPILAISINLIEKYGLMSSASLEIEPALQDALKKIIFAAARLNVGLVYFPSFGRSKINNQTDLDKTIKILQYACDVASQLPVLIATENTLSAAGNTLLIQKVNRSNLRLLLDTLNPIINGHSVLEFIETLFPFFADQIHVKDGLYGELGNCRLGEGDAHLRKTLTYLHEKGFKGSYILENNYLENEHELIEKDLNLLSAIHSEIISKGKDAARGFNKK